MVIDACPYSPLAVRQSSGLQLGAGGERGSARAHPRADLVRSRDASDGGELFGIMPNIVVEGGAEVIDLRMVLKPAAKVRVRLEGEEDAAGFRVLQHGVPVGYDWFREGRESIVPVSPGPCLVELLSAADGAVLEEREVFTSLGEVADVMFRRSE